jgi:hypothetical protein
MVNVIAHRGSGRLPGVENHARIAPTGTGRPRPGGVLVIGVGNDLRGDDGAGRAVVEELARLAVHGMHPVWSHQLVPELAEQISKAGMVIFVDAGLVDAGLVDAGLVDAGLVDAGLTDAGRPCPAGPGPAGPDPARGSTGGHGVEVRPVTASQPAVGGHQADPGALLGLAALAGLDVPPAFVVTVPAHDLGLGTQLSAPTRAAVADAVAEVLRLASPVRPPGGPEGRRVDGTA